MTAPLTMLSALSTVTLTRIGADQVRPADVLRFTASGSPPNAASGGGQAG